MIHVFVDTDVCIDLLSGREPFVKAAEQLFSLSDQQVIQIYVSSLSFSNIDYILRAHHPLHYSRQIIARFKTLVQVLSVHEKTIDLAIASDFSDFEDAIQYSCAIENNLGMIVTRNIKDFKKASIHVLTPEAFLAAIA
jgi:predicted nucleic acid-binding protein